jgi:hypothetical protein
MLSFTNAFTDLWFVSFLLLLLQAHLVRPVVPGPVNVRAHPVVWLSLVLSKGLMYLATPAAYLQLSAGAIGAIEGFRRGHWSLASALLIFSVLGLYGLWTMWSISTRTWVHRRYVVSSSGQVKDTRGLLAAWAGGIGLGAISTAIFRGEDVLIFSVLLLPSLLVTTVIACAMAPASIEEPARMPLSGLMQRIQGRHYVGMVAGLVAGLSGLTLLIPPTHSGWGPCDWTIMFPIGIDLWPEERGIIEDACSTGPGYQIIVLGVASFVFWTSGLLTVVIGRSSDPWQGALAAAVAASSVLTWTVIGRVNEVLGLPLKPLPPISQYIDWISTIGVGVAVVLWAARLGYLGGRRGARQVEPTMESQ